MGFRTMISRLSVILVVALLISIVPRQTMVGQQRTKSNVESIPVIKLNRSKVIGSLGLPLGEVVTIEGITADGEYTRRKADAGETLLRVQTVNGRPLKREAIFHFRPFEGADLKKPRAGMRFKYIGYETGGFSGIPDKAFDYVPRVATDGYYFTTSLVILRDFSVK